MEVCWRNGGSLHKLFINMTEVDNTDTNAVTVATSLSSIDQRSQSPFEAFQFAPERSIIQHVRSSNWSFTGS